MNEISGACVAANQLKGILKTKGNKISYCCPQGDFIKADIELPIIGTNFLTQLCWFIKNKGELNSYDSIVCLTLRCFFIAFLFRSKSILYIHEDIVGPKVLFIILSWLIRLFLPKIAIVNPSLKRFYGAKASTIPNVFIDVTTVEKLCKNVDFIMISNFSAKKGIYKFQELARVYPDKKFVLLTNRELADFNELVCYKKNSTGNLSVVMEQALKNELLSRSRFVVNLSELNETFGLTHFEAVIHNALPISFINQGSLYVLGSGYPMLNSNDFINSFDEIVSKLEGEYDIFHRELLNRFNHKFSRSLVRRKLLVLMNVNI